MVSGEKHGIFAPRGGGTQLAERRRMHSRAQRKRNTRRARARGAVFVEYAVVVAIGIAIAAGMVSLGANEVAVYSNARAIIYSSNP
jgi:hypothetical protein